MFLKYLQDLLCFEKILIIMCFFFIWSFLRCSIKNINKYVGKNYQIVL